MKTSTFLVLAALCLLVGCVRSLNPIGSEEDLIFDPTLVGVWAEEDSKEVYVVTSNGDHGYTLVHTDEDCERGTFEMYLAQVEKTKFLVIAPAEPDLYANDFYTSLLISAYLFVRVENDGPEAIIWVMDTEWLKKYLEENPRAIEHSEGSLLTASTEKVRAFFLEHLETPGAFGEPTKMRRLTPEEAKGLTARCRATLPYRFPL